MQLTYERLSETVPPTLDMLRQRAALVSGYGLRITEHISYHRSTHVTRSFLGSESCYLHCLLPKSTELV